MILVCLILMPGKRETESCKAFLTVVCVLGGIWILRCIQGKFIETLHDILTLVLVLLLIWELFCTKLDMADPADWDILSKIIRIMRIIRMWLPVLFWLALWFPY